MHSVQHIDDNRPIFKMNHFQYRQLHDVDKRLRVTFALYWKAYIEIAPFKNIECTTWCNNTRTRHRFHLMLQLLPISSLKFQVYLRRTSAFGFQWQMAKRNKTYLPSKRTKLNAPARATVCVCVCAVRVPARTQASLLHLHKIHCGLRWWLLHFGS